MTREPKAVLIEFFRDDKGQMSMTRLLCFLSFWPASYVVMATKLPEALGWYLGAYVLGYIANKGADMTQAIKGKKDGDS